jgi:hypothetical protein
LDRIIDEGREDLLALGGLWAFSGFVDQALNQKDADAKLELTDR